MRYLGVALLAGAACASPATVIAPSTPAAPPPAQALIPPAAAPATTHARWVPRIAPAPFMSGASHTYGPVNNNFGTAATTYLGRDRVGMVVGGRRWLYEHDALTPVDVAGSKLEAMTVVPPALGGGFIFTTTDALLAADTFDGALRAIGPKQHFEVGPHSIFGDRGGLVSTADGKAIGPKDHLEQLIVHSKSGFAIAASATKSWLTTDGKTFKEIALPRPERGMAYRDALFVKTDKGTYRITADGKVAPSTKTQSELAERSFEDYFSVPNPAAEDGFPGALIDAGFVPTGRPDEWYAVRGRQVWRTNLHTRETKKLGALVGKDDDGLCSAGAFAPIHVSCFLLGRRLDMYSLDLDSGTTKPTYSFEAKPGEVVGFMGSPANTYPRTMTIMATCDGDTKTSGICIRDNSGTWKTFTRPADGTIAPFPGELLTLTATPDGGTELRDVGKGTRRAFAAADVPGTLATAGLLRTLDGLRVFQVPSPFEPSAKPIGYYVDYPLNPTVPMRVTAVPGVIAFAGSHALRLADGQLWETNDGWTNWYPVEPPPTGVPNDLAAAMCTEAGCVAGPWARLGWDR